MSDDVGNPIPECNCPNCGHRFSAASSLDDASAKPSAGDFTVCIECAQLLAFDDDLRVRKITAEEVRHIMTTTPEIWRKIEHTQRAVRAVQRPA